MSITINNHPPVLIMGRQPVRFRIYSNQTETPLRLSGGAVGYGSDSVPADSSNEAAFELSDYVKGLTTERYLLADEPAKYTGAIVAVEFAFAEIYGVPPTSNNAITTSVYYVLDGRVPRKKMGALYASYNNVLAFLVATKSCVSWWEPSQVKKVLPAQKEFLNYLQVQSGLAKDLHLEVTLLFTDGSTANMGQVFSTVSAVDYLEMTYWPAGYTQLGIAAWVSANAAGKTVHRYTLTIYNAATAYSAAYTFEVDRQYYDNSRTLYIKNSFGMLEILQCFGKGSALSEYEIETAVTSGLSTAEMQMWYNKKRDIVKVNTGYMTASQILWLADLIETTEAYELISGVLQPIVIKGNKIATGHDGNYQFSSEIEYEYSYQDVIEEGS